MDEALQDENKISKGRKVQLHVFEVNKCLQGYAVAMWHQLQNLCHLNSKDFNLLDSPPQSISTF